MGVAEVRRDFAKLQEMGITCDSGVNELRSRLEVVVRECDEHISKEQSRKAEGAAAFMNSLKLKQVLARSEDNGLSDRVQSWSMPVSRQSPCPQSYWKQQRVYR